MDLYFTTRQGKRPTNEDAHNIIRNLKGERGDNYAKINWYAIYDGHGNGIISEYLSNNLYKYFLSSSLVYPVSNEYISNAFNKMNEKIALNLKKDSVRGGSTALCVAQYKVMLDDHLLVMNTGDCRAIVCREGEDGSHCIQLTRDHNPMDPDEYSRIISKGGNIINDGYTWRINGLSVSRSFGDFDTYPYITCTPEVINYKVHKDDKYLIMACDGLFSDSDLITNDKIIDFVNGIRDKYKTRPKATPNISDRLASMILSEPYNSEDNVSIIYVPLNI